MKINEGETIGARLKQVRGTNTQQAFADTLVIGRTTLIKYESDERQPDAELLIKLNVLYGVQPLWLLTGKGPEGEGGLTPKESYLLAGYRGLDTKGKQAVEQLLAAMAPQYNLPKVAEPSSPTYGGSQQNFHGNVNNVAGRDVINERSKDRKK